MSPMRVYMTKEEALFSEWGEDISHQGSSTEDTFPMARPTNRIGSRAGVGPSGAVLSTKDIETEDLGSFKSKGEGQLVEHGEEVCSLSHLWEGILINNPCSKIREADLGKLRYFYKFPMLVEI